MASGAVNATKYLKRQGIDSTITYEGIVVNNDDPRKLCRVQARIPGLFDELADNELPWSSPRFNHPQGAYSEDSRVSGIAFVPKRNHKVGIRFPQADPHKPIWTSYTVDEQVRIPASETNYPDRAVIHLANGFYIIVDTRTNEIFFNNPGDMNMTILGDVNQYIVGNQNLTVTNAKSDIAGYLLNAPDTVLKDFNGRSAKKIKFPGLLGAGYSGNQHTTITGNQTTLVKGNRKVVVQGNDTLQIAKNLQVKVGMTSRLECTRSETNG